jgi:hypothetical protein
MESSSCSCGWVDYLMALKAGSGMVLGMVFGMVVGSLFGRLGLGMASAW